MKDLAELLEEELSEAVEVKNPKSLHRYIALLTGTHVEKSIHDQSYNELTGSIKEMLTSMHEGFRRMDEHFAAQDRRFDKQHKLISIGFTAMTLIIAAFNLTVILG